ncbi:MAG TPA: hypothetical protein V6D31_02895, partial [Candidatus Sericytochromatia bacterium]
LVTFLMNERKMSEKGANELIGEWKKPKQKVLFAWESARSKTRDTGKFFSFEETSIPSEPRYVSLGNREVYGYINPKHNSTEGMAILAKGLIKDAKYNYQPGKEKDWKYMSSEARFRCVATRKKDLTQAQVNLGHAPGKGASEHWNGSILGENPGHAQTKEQNQRWNKNPDNYHGPEDPGYSNSSGPNAEKYVVPGPHLEPRSHPMWWDRDDPNYVIIK